MDPRITYQRCQELQYSQFGSAQGLFNAMRDYQRMAPEKLTDATMESILWNKLGSVRIIAGAERDPRRISTGTTPEAFACRDDNSKDREEEERS